MINLEPSWDKWANAVREKNEIKVERDNALAELRAAVDALRPFAAMYQPSEIADIVAAYDAKHPEGEYSK